MPLSAIQALGAVQPTTASTAAGGASPLGAPGRVGGADATGASGTPLVGGANPADAFGATMSGAVQGLTEMQSTAKTLAVKAVTGDLTDIHDATIASTRAQVTLELVAAVRNKAVDAFSEIMRMQA